MSFSAVLDVAIGLILVYLLLSLVCAALKEMIESRLKWRSKNLEEGIRELLKGHTEEFYKHPLVFGLYRGAYNPNDKTNLPSYIPARTFALALMDLILPANSVTPSGASGATAAPSAAAPPAAVPLVGAVPAAPLAPVAPIISPALKPFRDQVAALTNKHLAQSLLPLIDAAGDDITKARQNIEGWFDSSMDRVSGWYKRHTQGLLFGLGLAVTVILNVDSLAVARHLFNDKGAREALVEIAERRVKDTEDRSPNEEKGNATPAETTADSKPKQEGASQDGPATSREPQSEINNVKAQVKNLTDLGLPIGWREQFKDWRLGHSLEPDSETWIAAVLFVVGSVPGWLVTALAVSLGAPFWFDTLNKFMVVRSTVKPKEKSPDEPPIG